MKTDSTWAEVLSRTDYYPFGLEMAGRTESNGYRYGFNGKEQDNPGMGGGGNTYDYGFRIYNPTIGKFLSVDPLAGKASAWSPYNSMWNNPLNFIDPDGRWAIPPGDYYDKNGNWITTDNKNDGKVYQASENGNITFGVGILEETKFKEWNYSIKDSKLEEYYPTLLSHEGGLVNHPSDPGGETNKGITFSTLTKYSEDLLGIKPTMTNLKRLSDSQVAAIYETGYWEPSSASEISDKQLGWLHFDTYLHGGASAVLRSTISSYGESGKSINTLNSILKVNSAEVVFNTYKKERLSRFNRLIESNYKLEDFRRGWIDRVNRFQYKTH